MTAQNWIGELEIIDVAVVEGNEDSRFGEAIRAGEEACDFVQRGHAKAAFQIADLPIELLGGAGKQAGVVFGGVFVADAVIVQDHQHRAVRDMFQQPGGSRGGAEIRY